MIPRGLTSDTLRTTVFCVLGVVVCAAILPEHPPWVRQPVWRVEGLMDASAFRTAGQLAGQAGLYDHSTVAQMQRRDAVVNGDARIFLRFPWYAVAVRWMAALPYPAAMAIWKFVLSFACAGFVLLWPERRAAGLALCWSLSAIAAIEQGQDTLIVLLLLGITMTCVRAGWDMLAGVALAFCTIKPHLLVFLPLLLIVQKRARVAVGFIGMFAVLVLVSFRVQGPEWPFAYLQQLAMPQLHSAVLATPTVAGLFPELSFRGRLLVCLASMVALLPLVFSICGNYPFATALASCLAAGVVVAPHAYLQDVALMIPLCLLVKSIPYARTSAIWLLSPLAAYPLARWTPVAGAALIVVPAVLILVSTALSPRQQLGRE